MRSATIACVTSLAMCAAPLTGQAQRRATTDWQLSDRPIELGAGTPEGEFTRIAGLTLLSGGGVAVADAVTQSIRVFDATGRFVHTIGRRGQGPGEYQAIALLAQAGDTLLVTEGFPGVGQVSRVVLPARFIGRSQLSPPDSLQRLVPLAWMVRRSVLVAKGGPRPVRPPDPGSTRRDSTLLAVVDLDRVRLRWLGPFPNRTWTSYRHTESVSGIAMAAHRLSPSLVLGASRNLVWIGDSGSGEIRGFDGTGALEARISSPMRPRPVEESRASSYLRALLADAPTANDSARIAAEHDASLAPKVAPRFQRIAQSHDPEVWIELFVEDPRLERTVLVFDEAGRPRGRLRLPPGTGIREVRDDRVLATRTDADGFEGVLVYRLSRSRQ